MPSPVETTDAAIAAWNGHDLSKVAGFYRPDVVLISPEGELKGREQATERDRAFLQSFPDARQEIVASHESGDTAIAEWVFHGTHEGPLPLPSGGTLPPTGKRIAVRGVDVVTVEDGMIARIHNYYDQVELLSQLGLMPEA